MPLEAANKILNNDSASRNKVNECIIRINREIGHLSCRCNSEPQLVPDLIELETVLTKLNEKLSLLDGRIDFLREEIPRVKAVIESLKAGGVERYNNKLPHVFGGKTYTSEELKEIPSETFDKTGEDFLKDLTDTLKKYQTEFKSLTAT